jgi:hypothetical protein
MEWIGCPLLSESEFTGFQDWQDECSHVMGFVAV